jgi:uncharacterized membrane protein YkoI
MKTPNKTKRMVLTSAAALGLLLGAAGLAGAVSGQSTVAVQPAPTPAPDTATTTTTVTDDDSTTDTGTDETNEGAEDPAAEAAEDAAEQTLLDSFPVSPDQAAAAASAAVPGNVDEVGISDDSANPVFEVEIIDANGQEIKVFVDPTSGAVIGQVTSAEDDANDVTEGPDNEMNEGPEANEAPEGAEAPAN